jgi:hypothetical protein
MEQGKPVADLKNIGVVVEPVAAEPAAPFGTDARSGHKYTTAQGFTAIRDGQKPRDAAALGNGVNSSSGKPRWLKALRRPADRAMTSCAGPCAPAPPGHRLRRGQVPQHR